MIYRDFGNTGVKVSQLGFGLMRLPIQVDKINDPESGKYINESLAIRMIDCAIDHGINYFDTAYVYHGGNSESLLGKTIVGNKRNKILIATKSPVWKVNQSSDFDTFLNEQLEKLGTDHIDFYLLHALNINSFKKACQLDALRFLDKAKASGKIRFAGFSFHDDYKSYPKIFESYDWDFSQILYNYFDAKMDKRPGKRGFEYASKRTSGLIIMEPLQGGNLAEFVPDEVKEIFDSTLLKRSPAEWALRWLWNFKQVSLLLSGMSTIEQLEENIKIANDAKPDTMTVVEIKAIESATKTFMKLRSIPCRGCKYCMPCPSGVNIPWIFNCYNMSQMFQDSPGPKKEYNFFSNPASRADKCTECGKCEEVCPRAIPIRQKLKEVHDSFTR